MKSVYSYIRFSKKHQAEGDSLRRQLEVASNYATKHGYELVDASFQDLGISAWSGVDRDGLDAMLECIESGSIAPHSVICIESVDRLSRQPYQETNNLIQKIINQDIELYISSDDMLINKATSNRIDNIIRLALKCELANQESNQKSYRLKQVFGQRKRDGNNGIKKAKKCPFWLTFNGTEYEFNDKLNIVKTIIQQKQNGIAMNKIAGGLNKLGMKTPRGADWSATVIAQILKSPALYGAWQTRKKLDGKYIDADLILDYYPAVISYDEFKGLISVKKGRGNISQDNHFRGLLRCYCGAAMIKVRQGLNNYFQCTDGKTKQNCLNKPIKADVLELTVFSICRGMKQLTVSIKENDKIFQQISQKELALSQVEDRIRSGGDVLTYMDILESLKQDIADLKSQIINKDDIDNEHIQRLNDLKNNPVQWNELAHRFIEKIEVQVIGQNYKPKDFRIRLYQKNGIAETAYTDTPEAKAYDWCIPLD